MFCDRRRVLAFIKRTMSAPQEQPDMQRVKVHSYKQRKEKASVLMKKILSDRLPGKPSVHSLDDYILPYHTIEIDKIKWYRGQKVDDWRNDEGENIREPMYMSYPSAEESLRKKQPFWFAEYVGAFKHKAPSGEVSLMSLCNYIHSNA